MHLGGLCYLYKQRQCYSKMHNTVIDLWSTLRHENARFLSEKMW